MTDCSPESASAVVEASVTVPFRRLPGSVIDAVGAVVSIRTWVDFAGSRLPATSRERYEIVWVPSHEWSAGAGIETVEPLT